MAGNKLFFELTSVFSGLNFEVPFRNLEGEEGINSSATTVLKEKKESILKRFVQKCAEFISNIRLQRQV